MTIDYIGKCLLIETDGKKILVIGDLHLGYEQVLNESGIFLTRKMFEEMIKYLDKVFMKAGKVDHIILLGDVKHNFGGILRQEWNDVLGLFDYFENKLGKNGKLLICKGNHDVILEPIVRKREKVEMREHFVIDGVAFIHGNRDYDVIHDKKIKMWVLGHGHPAVKLKESVKVESYKCFLEGKYKGKKIIIVPSFFEYNEGSDPRERDLGMAWKFNYNKFRAWVIDEEEMKILDFGELGKLK